MQDKADSKLRNVLETCKLQQLMPQVHIDTPTQPATEAFRLLRLRLYLISRYLICRARLVAHPVTVGISSHLRPHQDIFRRVIP